MPHSHRLVYVDLLAVMNITVVIIVNECSLCVVWCCDVLCIFARLHTCDCCLTLNVSY